MHLILFDIDGTLICGKGLGRFALEGAFGEVFEKNLEEHPAVNDVFYAGSTDPHILSDLAQAMNIAPHEYRAREDRLIERYLVRLRERAFRHPSGQACTGAGPVLERLHQREGVALGLVTGNMEAGARIKLEPAGFNRFFAFGGFGGDGPTRTDLARLAQERAEERTGLRYAPDRVLVVGDTVNDVEAGSAHGYCTVGVATGSNTSPELTAAGADAVFNDLAPENGFETWLEERFF